MILRHTAAAGLALAALPLAHRALAVTGHSYGVAWALVAGAAVLDRRRGGWLWRTALWLAVLAAVTDLPVIRQTVTYLTGASW